MTTALTRRHLLTAALATAALATGVAVPLVGAGRARHGTARLSDTI